jgi:8-oxo-dGTP pyrophosphatase MutT (NUDIX family)
MIDGKELYDALKNETLHLPGEKYQLKMSPEHRSLHFENSSEAMDASVALIILESPKPEMLLIKRNEYEGVHSGQVSFPGGKKDPEDRTLLETAIRETHEEIGIHLKEEEYIGELSHLDIVVSGYRVHPFLFLVNRDYVLQPDENEVAYIIRFQIEELLSAQVVKTHLFTFKQYEFEAPYFDLSNEIVWGATSMILAEFREILLRISKKNPGLNQPG